MKRLSKSMVVCFMAAVMMMTVGCQKEEITPIIPDSPIIPDGALPGLFSVSATQQVYFSQGNLQYQASTNTWRFAEHQYDYVGTQTADGYGDYGGNVSGSDNRNISSTYNGWIDLFGWGTGSNPTLSSSYPEDYGTFMDWGCNAISNGGNTANQWRTLTRAEWYYLLNTRTDASSKRGTGNINGVGQDTPLMTLTGHATATHLPSGRRWRQLVQYSCLRRAAATARMSTAWAATASIGRPRPAVGTCTLAATLSA